MKSAEQICKRIVRQAGSSFSPSFIFLDGEQRRAMRALYAYCRVIDDIVDEPGDLQVKEEQLADWHHRIAEIFADNALPPSNDDAGAIAAELGWARQHFALHEQYLLDLIEGVRFDLVPGPMPDYETLLHYCYGVAGTVGLSCLAIFRVEEAETTRAAGLALAKAFQLTNILRDLRSDAEIGRCYIPAADMAQFDLDPDDFLHAFHAPYTQSRVQELVTFYVGRAGQFYREAWDGFAEVDAKKLRAARAMSNYYFAILQKIRQRPARVLEQRVGVSSWKKCQLLFMS